MMLAGCWMPWFKNYCCVAPCWGRPWHLQILIDACSTKIDLIYFCYVFLFSRSGTFNMKEPDRSSYDICRQQSIRTPGEYIFGNNLSHEGITAPVQVKNDKFFVQFFLLFLSWFLICCLSTKNLLVQSGFPNPVVKFGWRHWIFPLTQQYHPGRLKTAFFYIFSIYFDHLINCNGIESQRRTLSNFHND